MSATEARDEIPAILESCRKSGHHALEVNLVRVGLPVHLVDQVIAEVEDSYWLATVIAEAQRRRP